MKIIRPKYYLNTKLKPIIENGVEKFPVYFRFNLNGKNHRIPSFFIQEYLKNEEDLDSYTLEKEDEEFFVNFLFSKNENFDFRNFFIYVQGIAIPIKELFLDYLYTNNEPLLDSRCLYSTNSFMEKYKKELISYISTSSDLSYHFLNIFFVNYPTVNLDQYPVSFIKDEDTRFIFETYNLVLSFSKKKYIHTYDWVERRLGQSFKNIHGEEHFQIIDKLVTDHIKSHSI